MTFEKIALSAPIPIFIISLPTAAERRENMATQMEKLGLDYCFFDGVDGHALPPEHSAFYNVRRRLRVIGKPLSAGEVGCTLTHANVYQHMLKERIELAIVLEDDVIIGPEFAGVIEALSRVLSDFDIARFLSGPKIARSAKRLTRPLTDKHGLYQLLKLSCGAYGYAVTRAGAAKLLDAMAHSAFPIDMLIARAWESKVKSRIVLPSPVMHDNAVISSIGKQRFSDPKPQHFLKRINRAVFKIDEALRKHGQYWLAY